MSDALEQAQCALANLDNLAKTVPHLKSNPFFKIVKMQIEELIKALEEGE